MLKAAGYHHLNLTPNKCSFLETMRKIWAETTADTYVAIHFRRILLGGERLL
jgi:hypothetical protein